MSPAQLLGRYVAVAVISVRAAQSNHRGGTEPLMSEVRSQKAACSATARPVRATSAFLTFALAIAAGMLVSVGVAHAGSYQINNCPSAPVSNGDAGAWVILAGQQGSKASCGGGPGDYIAPLGANMSPGTIDGVEISSPPGSGVTISEAKVWWYVPQDSSGATIFAIAAATGGAVGEYATPTDYRGSPDVLVLPSSTTSLTLADYCSNDDAGQGCAFGDDRPNLLLFGSQLTLSDSRLPNGAVTGGGVTGAGPLSATQAIAYNVEDGDSGVRLVELLIDGQDVARNDYGAKCPYASFLACPATESDTLSWNTAAVPDGQHSAVLVVQSAAQNRRTIFASTITTHNAPTNLTAPAIAGQEQPSVETALTASPGAWSAPAGAGPTAYSTQWQSCDAEGSRCTAISGAVAATYTPASADVGHTLRMLVSAANYDGSTTALSGPTGVVAGTEAPPRGAAGGGAGSLDREAPAANGSAASEAAQLHLGVRGPLARTFAARALRLPGRLMNSAGQPIAGADVDVLARDSGSGRVRVIGHARTGTDGSFLANVPPGSSRRVEVAYRAFGSDGAYSAQASVQETVSAGVKLRVTPRRASPTSTIRLSGQVQGPIPADGVIVELLVHYRGRWEPLRTPRTGPNGRFAASYQFQGAVGRFPFRAEVFGGQSAFPYSTGTSDSVDVTTR